MIQTQPPPPGAPAGGKGMQIEQWMRSKRKEKHSEMVTGGTVIKNTCKQRQAPVNENDIGKNREVDVPSADI